MAKPPRKQNTGKGTRVPFKIHPRAFKALGADLVTNDAVAIIELVKNSYDAYATEVDIGFREESDAQSLEIKDNGSGMDRDVIENAWCTVATTYRRDNPEARRRGRRTRRTSGEKGLGRLSAARLGPVFQMITQTAGGQCWRVDVNWDDLALADNLNQCVATITSESNSPFQNSGTLIRITPLRTNWTDAAIDDLRENLARLMPPFETKDNFSMRLSRPSLFEDSIEIEPPEFLMHPKYSISGSVELSGSVHFQYEFNAITGNGHRNANGTIAWSQIRDESTYYLLDKMTHPECGPFCFEIRCWDIGPDDTQEISDRFEYKKSYIRKDIRAYKGISVYRDSVLVLPKSEGGKDWLGLDLKRVGRVGHHLSTTQLVGHVAITAKDNPRLEDTSDRERMASTPEVVAFEEMLRAIVKTLANERAKDRGDIAKERQVVELFKELSARKLVVDASEVAKDDGPAADVVPLIEDFSDKLERTREQIETRFVYYSRLATVGTIAQMLMHEVRNRTSVLGKMISAFKAMLEKKSEGKRLVSRLHLGEAALAALDRLAETFAPLANRQFRRRMRSACIEESLARCVLMLDGDLKEHKIKVMLPREGVTKVAIDPGELDAVLLNLLSNAVYWLSHKDKGQRKIDITSRKLRGQKRVRIDIHDSGPGVSVDDAERIFWPGVTNKPGGIGMGLTVACELVSEYGGQLALDRGGKLGGATFFFDIPLR